MAVQEEDWRARESAILALGAIAEGCVMGLIPYLPQLISMLLPRLEDPRPLVRSGSSLMPLKCPNTVLSCCVCPANLNPAEVQYSLELNHGSECFAVCLSVHRPSNRIRLALKLNSLAEACLSVHCHLSSVSVSVSGVLEACLTNASAVARVNMLCT